MTGPLFTVVIPAFNAPATIGRAIESALAQTVDDVEVVVVDDGSTDDTAARAREHASDPRVRVLEQANQGVAGAKNAGISVAKGSLIAFLDNDDLLMPSYLEEMRDAMAGAPNAGFAFADGWLLDEATRRLSRRSMSPHPIPDAMPEDGEALAKALVYRNFIATAVTVRGEALARVGHYDPRANGADDVELWLRMLASGWQGVRAPGRLVVKGYRDDAQSRDSPKMNAALRTALGLFCEQKGAPPDAVAAARVRIEELHEEDRAMAMAGGPGAAIRELAKRVAYPLRWHRRPPAEVRRAFPFLG